MQHQRGNGYRGPKKAVPDRWEIYSNAGTRIPGTRFICMKVPLKKEICDRLEKSEQQFTPSLMVAELAKQGMKMGLLIDLTYTTRYYHPEEVENLGVAYEKIMVEGQEVPASRHVKRFCDIVDKFDKEKEQDESFVIGVHCTHGINRTGYLVCRYLIDRKGWTVEKAITEFNQARGHSIERENYLTALQKPIVEEETSHTRAATEEQPFSRDSTSFNKDRRNNGEDYRRPPLLGSWGRDNYGAGTSTHAWDRQMRSHSSRGQEWVDHRQHSSRYDQHYGRRNNFYDDPGWTRQQRQDFYYDNGRHERREYPARGEWIEPQRGNGWDHSQYAWRNPKPNYAGHNYSFP